MKIRSFLKKDSAAEKYSYDHQGLPQNTGYSALHGVAHPHFSELSRSCSLKIDKKLLPLLK